MSSQPPLKRGVIEHLDHVGKKQRSSAKGFTDQPRQAKQPPKSFGDLPEHLISHIVSYLVPESFELSEKLTLYNGMEGVQWANFLACRTALMSLGVTCRALRHLSLPLLYQNIVITEFSSLLKLLMNLIRYPERGQPVRQLTCTLPGELVKDTDALLSIWDQLGGEQSLFPKEHISAAPAQYKAALAHLKGKSKRLFGTCTWNGVGAVILPILTLTPRVTIVNIWGPREWLTEKYTIAIKDLFFRFLNGINTRYPDLLSLLFPTRLFGMHLGPPGTRPAFPPPFLEVMTNVTFDKDAGEYCEGRPMVNRLSVHPPRDIHELLDLTIEMETELDINIDDDGWISPSFVAPSAIGKASSKRFMSIRSYLERIRPLNVLGVSREQWTEDINWLIRYLDNDRAACDIRGWERLDDLTEPFRNSLHASLMSAQTEIVAQYRQDITSSLVEFIELGHLARPSVESPVPTKTLTLTHPPSLYIERDLALTPDGENLALCITSRYEYISDLTMVLRLHKDNRRDIYQAFSPAGCFHLRNLVITIEGLWGPMTTVFKMLEKDECTDKVDDQGHGQWAEKRKAVERIPPKLETLRVIDWFAEYRPELARDRVAVANDRAEWEDDDLHVDDGPNGGFNDTPFYVYSTIRDEKNLRTIYNPRNISAFSSRYIECFTKGLTSLCVTRAPAQNRHHTPTKPLLAQMRPSLQTIEFVYTLQSKLTRLERSFYAHSADDRWRLWYHIGGYESLRRRIKEQSGIDLVIWEGEAGVPPQTPFVFLNQAPELELDIAALARVLTESRQNRGRGAWDSWDRIRDRINSERLGSVDAWFTGRNDAS